MNRLYRWMGVDPKITSGRYAAMDGYRGIFVLLVMLYHLGYTGLAGGWVGINHFFVFSGFLISTLLIKERQKTGAIKIFRFYGRRIARIVPPMLLLVAAVIGHTAFFAPEEVKGRFGGDAFATLGFFLNWRLISRDDAYFEHFGNPSPLRHVWTLSVEEQFYVLIPFIILVLTALVKKRVYRVSLMFLAAGASAWWTAHLGYHSIADQARLYYGTDTRMQALLVGVAMGFAFGIGADGRMPIQLSRGLAHFLGIIGFALSLSAIFILTPTSEWVYNNGGMLIFALGASLMGWSSIDDRGLLLNRLVSFAPLVFLGQLSYGLYLFHWPINLWMPLEDWPLAAAAALKLLLTLIVAVLSFRYLEWPILQKGLAGIWPRLPQKLRLGAALAIVAGLSIAAGLLWATPAPPIPAHSPDLIALQKPFQPPKEEKHALLIGDSVGGSLAAGWREDLYPGITMTNATKIGCDTTNEPALRDGQTSHPEKACYTWWNTLEKKISAEHPDMVIYMGDTHFLTSHLTPDGPAIPGQESGAKLIGRTLDVIWHKTRSAGVKKLGIINMPCRRINPARLDASIRSFAAEGSDDQKVRWANKVMEEWVKRTPGTHVIDIYTPLCGAGFRENINGIPIYSDTLHFTKPTAAMLWKFMTPWIVDPENWNDGKEPAQTPQTPLKPSPNPTPAESAAANHGTK